jgi:uncharacterized membrane protein
MRLLLSTIASAAALSAAVDFKAQVQPILTRECAACHGAERPAGGVKITDRASVLSDRMVVPGKPEASLLYRVIELPAGTSKAMPPGKQLAKADRDVIKQWITEGAVWPEGTVVSGAAAPKADERSTVQKIHAKIAAGPI